jgi:hypothetical protein
LEKNAPPLNLLIAMTVFFLGKTDSDYEALLDGRKHITCEQKKFLLDKIIQLIENDLSEKGSINVRELPFFILNFSFFKADNNLIDSEELSTRGELAVWYRKEAKKLELKNFMLFRAIRASLDDCTNMEECSCLKTSWWKWFENVWTELSNVKQKQTT